MDDAGIEKAKRLQSMGIDPFNNDGTLKDDYDVWHEQYKNEYSKRLGKDQTSRNHNKVQKELKTDPKWGNPPPISNTGLTDLDLAKNRAADAASGRLNTQQMSKESAMPTNDAKKRKALVDDVRKRNKKDKDPEVRNRKVTHMDDYLAEMGPDNVKKALASGDREDKKAGHTRFKEGQLEKQRKADTAPLNRKQRDKLMGDLTAAGGSYKKIEPSEETTMASKKTGTKDSGKKSKNAKGKAASTDKTDAVDAAGAKAKDAVAAANKLYEQYRLNPHTITDNRQRQLLEQIDNLDNAKFTLTSKLDAANKAGAPYREKAERVINQQAGVKIGSKSFTAKDLYDFERSTSKYVHYYNVRTGNGPETRSLMRDDILNDYKGTKYYPIALALYNSFNKKDMSKDETVIMNQIRKINSATQRDVAMLTKKQQEAESKTIYDLSPEFQQMNIQLNPGNKRDMNTIEQIIGLKTKDYNELGSLDSAHPNDFKPATLGEMRGEGKKPSYTYVKKKDGSATLVITEGDDIQKIPLTAQEFRSWATDYSYVNPMSDVIYSVQASKNKTTNKANKQEASTARYTGYSQLLPGFNNTKIASRVRMDIEGSPDNIGNADTDVFQARLYYYDGKQWKDEVLNSGGYVDAANLQILLSQTGQKTIETLFK